MNATDDNLLSVSRHMRRRKYLLSGLVKCGICGGSMTVAGGTTKGSIRRYYCANAKEKGASVCVGMPGIPQRNVEEFALAGLRDGLMQPAAYEQFRKDFLQKMQSSQSAAEEHLALLDKRIRTLERAKANLIIAIKSGAIVEDLAEEYNKVSAGYKPCRRNGSRRNLRPSTCPRTCRQSTANILLISWQLCPTRLSRVMQGTNCGRRSTASRSGTTALAATPSRLKGRLSSFRKRVA